MAKIRTATKEVCEKAARTAMEICSRGLDAAGATEELSYKTIAKCHKDRNGNVKLNAVKIALTLRGLFAESHKVEAEIDIGSRLAEAIRKATNGNGNGNRKD